MQAIQKREDYRISVYLGTKTTGRALLDRIHQHTAVDIRFRGSPMNFIRYAINYTLDHDPSLNNKRQKVA